MKKWTALILTCPNKNSSLAYQKELQLRQKKGFIDKETLIICIEDPEAPIGSGGATLNSLLIVTESLSAMKKFKMTEPEVLKDEYILMMHMGRQYPLDITGKAFTTFPFQDKNTNNLLSNFDILYNLMTYQVAGFKNSSAHSDPGIYICSTDMVYILPEDENIIIKDSEICVVSSPIDQKVASKNGIYSLDPTKKFVKKIFFQPDEECLKSNMEDSFFNLVTGIVYFNYEIAQNLCRLLFIPPLDACNYIGVDSGAIPLSLSLFFDIILPCCDGISKDDYLNGSLKTNNFVPLNQTVLLKQARLALWNSLNNYKIKNVSVKNFKYYYLDNQTLESRANVFSDHESICQYKKNLKQFDSSIANIYALNSLLINSKITTTGFGNSLNYMINTILEDSNLKIGKNAHLNNCSFKSSKVEIGENTLLNDIILDNLFYKFPENLFVQSVDLNLQGFNISVKMNIVFGINDNLLINFDEKNWTFLNQTWSTFRENMHNLIEPNDLWSSDINANERCLRNAKLYPLFTLENSLKIEMNDIAQFFWIHSNSYSKKNLDAVKIWKNSYRLSIDDILKNSDYSKAFQNRRCIFNRVNLKTLVKSVVENKAIQFNDIIKNAVMDGYANELLELFDEAAMQNSSNLILLPRIMAFISTTLCEMSIDLKSIRSGPNLNANWMNAFQHIENFQIKKAIVELSKIRKNWMQRNDLLIRAARHYEGAMLAFIRQATMPDPDRVVLNQIKETKSNYEWVVCSCPCRIDLAGGWSDTPPITYDVPPSGSCVVNVSVLVNGKKPIGAKARIVKKQKTNNSCFLRVIMRDSLDNDEQSNQSSFEFHNIDDFKDYNKPQATCCLVKAVCIFTKLVILDSPESLSNQLESKLNGTLELHTWTGLPQGSGLGTSSILIACVLKVVWYMMGIEVSNESLSYSILLVEQLMTTNGGWQDQVGGIWPGFKLTTAKNQLPLEINIKQLTLSKEFLDIINSRLVLIYTGITRLAKDLLLNVIRNWYAISKDIYDNVQELVKNAYKCSRAISNENLAELGACINNYRKQKLIMAPGSEPDTVSELMQIIGPYVHGMSLAGAGGGGFLYALTKETNGKEIIEQLISENKLNMKIYDAKISPDGIDLSFF